MLQVPRWLAIGLVVVIPALQPARAQSRPTALAKAWQNPIGSVINVPFDNSFGFEQDSARSIYALDVRGIVPIRFNDGNRLVPRILLPFSEVPFTDGSHFDIGDTRVDVLYAGGCTAAHDGFSIGLGPALSIPTATSSALTSGKWEAGLSFAQVASQGRWVLGAQLSQLWSFAGSSSHRTTSPFIAEPFLYFNFDEGWSLLSAPEIRADWQVARNDGWTLPLGGGIAKTFGDHQQGVAASVSAYANSVRAAGAPSWTLHARLSLLYPR